ncbi:riboflavin synthase alpha chain [Persephonella hydrogeniphila]|uniref:Riboflavin synthase n=1 Tax=Persephonella hydrogeniphila TaxID=198703 RepID=A0A285NBL5_9AQUI|nr:riboflavin synthase [Persephonella hydrogeniphila]SNZ06819.1 riboflavin synthase alpha chain [Persephonella hydrogeniphila]
MFTGLVEEVGKIKTVKTSTGGLTIQVQVKKITDDIKVGDSVAVNGVCLTVTGIQGDTISFDVSQETVRRSNIGQLRNGDLVNIERALKLSDRLGGHIVQGHVDTVGTVKRIIPKGEHTEFVIHFPEEFQDFVVEKGSIAIDGISLTINEVYGNEISINIIPHTIQNTNLKNRKTGEAVNIEFDILGKYVKRMLSKNKISKLEDLLENF